jgi:O-antigen/teichoic acid export membrane protein
MADGSVLGRVIPEARTWVAGRGANVIAAMVRVGGRGAFILYAPIILPVKSFAVYAIFLASLYAISLLSALGTPMTIMRERQGELPLAGLFLHSLFLAIGGSVLLSAVVAPTEPLPFFLLVSAGAAATNLQLFAASRARALGRFRSVLASEIAVATALGLGMVLLGIRESTCSPSCTSYVGLALTQIVALLIGAVVLLAPRRSWLTSSELRFGGLRPHLPSVYWIGLIVVFDLFIWSRIEVYFLEHSPDGLLGVAVFGLAVQLSTLPLVPIMGILEAWYPTFASSFEQGEQAFATTLRQRSSAYRTVYLVLGALGIGAVVLTIQVILPRYEPWLWAIVTIVGIRLVTGYAGFHATVLYACRQEKRLLVAVVAGAGLALLSNSLLTLSFGLPGAIISYLATQSVVAGLTLVVYGRSKIGSREPLLRRSAALP